MQLAVMMSSHQVCSQHLNLVGSPPCPYSYSHLLRQLLLHSTSVNYTQPLQSNRASMSPLVCHLTHSPHQHEKQCLSNTIHRRRHRVATDHSTIGGGKGSAFQLAPTPVTPKQLQRHHKGGAQRHQNWRRQQRQNWCRHQKLRWPSGSNASL